MKGVTTVSRILACLVLLMIPVAAAAGGHTYQMPTMPNYQPPSYHVSPVPSYQQPPYQWAPAPTHQPTYQRPAVDLQGIIDSLRMPDHHQRDLNLLMRNQRRNAITIPGCHKYNIACLNELRSLD